MDLTTGKIVTRLNLTDAGGERMQFTPDGKHLAFVYTFDTTLVDVETGKAVRSMDTRICAEGGVTFTEDGKWMAAQLNEYTRDARVGIWDPKTGAEVMKLPGRGARSRGILFGRDGKRLLLWSTMPTHVEEKKSLGFGPESRVALACIDIATRKIIGETTIATTQHAALRLEN
jgi:hypothetical protein